MIIAFFLCTVHAANNKTCMFYTIFKHIKIPVKNEQPGTENLGLATWN